jgi:hypothetical protein
MTKKIYANEHPRNKTKTKDKEYVKVASSKSAQNRKRKLQEMFEGEVLMWESAHDMSMPASQQDELYKSLRRKILGR